MSSKVLSKERIRELAPSVFAEQPHSDVSDKYRFIPTTQVMDVLMGEGWVPVEASEQRTRKSHRNGYQTHILKFEHSELDLRAEDGTVIQAILVNAHDRSSAYKFYVGAYRLICTNGLVIATEKIGQFKIRHIGYDDFNVMEASKRIIESAPVIHDRVSRFSQVQLTNEKQIEFARAAMKLRWNEEQLAKMTLKPELINNARRKADEGDNLWLTYNRIQENLISGGIRYQTIGEEGEVKNATSRKVNSIINDVKINENLWKLAETFSN